MPKARIGLATPSPRRQKRRVKFSEKCSCLFGRSPKRRLLHFCLGVESNHRPQLFQSCALPLSYLGIKSCNFFSKSGSPHSMRGETAELILLPILPMFSTPEVSPLNISTYWEKNGSI